MPADRRRFQPKTGGETGFQRLPAMPKKIIIMPKKDKLFQIDGMKIGTMSDPTPPTPAPEPPPSNRSRLPIDKATATELDFAEQLVATAQKTDFAIMLAGEEVDAAFLAGVTGKIGEADTLISQITGGTADKEAATQAEAAAQKALLAQISKVQKRAKRKYAATDPNRKKYFIGEHLAASRPILEGNAKAIILTLATDTLPGHKPADTTALDTALTAYKQTKTDQVGGQGGVRTAHSLLDAKVKEVAGLRRQIQYAADTCWPPADPANTGIRKQFSLPPDKALK
jgi:hypothetical protein